MLAKVHSGAVYGVDAYPVEIEVNTGRGDPQTVIVGLPDALRLCSGQVAVKESKDRVNTAILNSRLRSEATPRHAGVPRRPRCGSGTSGHLSRCGCAIGMTWRPADSAWRAGHDG